MDLLAIIKSIQFSFSQQQFNRVFIYSDSLLYLKLEFDKINDISLNFCAQIKQLFLQGNTIRDITLLHLVDLIALDMSENPISKIDLKYNTQLQLLHLNLTKITCLNLENNNKLAKFSCYKVPLTHIDYPPSLPNMRVFDVSNTLLANLNFKIMPLLEHVYLYGMNHIKKRSIAFKPSIRAFWENMYE